MKGIKVDVKSSRDGVAIDTIFPPRKNWWSDRSGTVDYTVIVPQTIRIAKLDLVNGEVLIEGLNGGSATAHLINGGLSGHNCFGDLDLSIVNGRLDVVYDWWEEGTFSAKASSGRGHLTAILPDDASIKISARTETGQIANDFETNEDSEDEVTRVVDTSIGTEAPASLTLRATSGDIRIEKSD